MELEQAAGLKRVKNGNVGLLRKKEKGDSHDKGQNEGLTLIAALISAYILCKIEQL
jgi:hypothetical protein